VSLVDHIISPDPALRDRSLFEACAELSDTALLDQCQVIDQFWPTAENLYERVRALMFLYAIHRFVLPERGLCPAYHPVPQKAVEKLFSRRFAHAIQELLAVPEQPRQSDTYVSGLAEAYHGLALQNLADQVRNCVRSVPGNRWMFRIGHPSAIPLQIRPELIAKDRFGHRPCLVERTAVRMDLSHSAWSDIFFLAMDRPEFARVVNISVDLSIRASEGGPKPPVEAWFRIIDRPIIRLVSVDLEATAEIDNLPEVFDFGRDYLGLLKAALVASGLIPPGLEGCGASLESVLEKLLGPGRGIELISCVHNIPKGSRLAVSTNLMAACIAVCMRATGQIENLDGGLVPEERSMLAVRSILGEWLGGSGGGWQDSGGVWPGIKLISGVAARADDVEHGVSRGRLAPQHKIFSVDDIPPRAREKLQESLILVHGGLAQNVGPILEMVTERYLLRESSSWEARQEALRLTEAITDALKAGDIKRLGQLTTENFFGPIKTIIPWASNAFTEALIEAVGAALGEDYWGFWMLGGMSGGGMGLIVDPDRQEEAKSIIADCLKNLKSRYASSLPFAIDPVIYDFSINEQGSWAQFGQQTLPKAYYDLRLPVLMRLQPEALQSEDRQDLDKMREAADPELLDDWFKLLLPQTSRNDGGSTAGAEATGLGRSMRENGFDKVVHERIRGQLIEGRIGLAQNRLPADAKIGDAEDQDLERPNGDADARRLGEAALANGEVAVVTLAAGAGSRWTQGAGVVKALHPFARFGARYRNFLEVHLAKSARCGEAAGADIPHVFTTSYLTHGPIEDWFRTTGSAQGRAHLSRGGFVGLRLIPTLRDLRFAWEETPQPRLDAQAQKMRDSVRAALKRWAAATGEAADYRDNLPNQCMHPVGHWYELPGLLLNGTLHRLLAERPGLRTLLLHNIDTLGAIPDPELLGRHRRNGHVLDFELISRRFDDVGGGLARVNGRPRLVEGMALPHESDEYKLRYYNTLTTWIDIDGLLAAFGLNRERLADQAQVRASVNTFAERMPAYLTLKEVKKRWGRGQEDIFPVLQFERLWGDMSALDEMPTGYFHVDRLRGQQLKDAAQLDAWLRDGSHAYIDSLCQFGGR